MLKIDFINVGYGDSTLIRLYEGSSLACSMLIDCGDITVGEVSDKSKKIKAVDFLKKEGISTLDFLVITHLHLDHTGGLTDLIREIKVKTLWANYLPPQRYWGKKILYSRELSSGAQCLLTSLNIYLQALEMLRKGGTKIVFYNENSQKTIAEQFKVDMFMEEDLLERQEQIWSRTLEGGIINEDLEELDLFINNTSLRMRFCYGGRIVELPGDIYARRWEQRHLAKCDIIKIPHHGHGDSVTEKLVEMLRPEYAVISVSNSRSDCPDTEIVELLALHSKAILFTDAVSITGNNPIYHESVGFSIGRDGFVKISI